MRKHHVGSYLILATNGRTQFASHQVFRLAEHRVMYPDVSFYVRNPIFLSTHLAHVRHLAAYFYVYIK